MLGELQVALNRISAQEDAFGVLDRQKDQINL